MDERLTKEEQQHRLDVRLEVYKSVIAFSTMSIRTLFLLNGGAALALTGLMARTLAALDDTDANPKIPEQFQAAIGSFGTGLVVAAVCLAVGYFSQLQLFQRWNGDPSPKAVPAAVRYAFFPAMILAFLSIGFFVDGSFRALGEEGFLWNLADILGDAANPDVPEAQ